MKRAIYIAAFTLLGVLAQFIVHALFETWYIGLLTANFPRYSFGLSWKNWEQIHHILTGVLIVAGILFGFFSGRTWWRRIYLEQWRSSRRHWFNSVTGFDWVWTPAAWQGWLVLIAYIVALIAVFRRIDRFSHSASDTLIGFAVPFVLISVLFLFICYKTGQKPIWRWKSPKER